LNVELLFATELQIRACGCFLGNRIAAIILHFARQTLEKAQSLLSGGKIPGAQGKALRGYCK
jgi:hypothetical protein